jgi:hypothetical protein
VAEVTIPVAVCEALPVEAREDSLAVARGAIPVVKREAFQAARFAAMPVAAVAMRAAATTVVAVMVTGVAMGTATVPAFTEATAIMAAPIAARLATMTNGETGFPVV